MCYSQTHILLSVHGLAAVGYIPTGVWPVRQSLRQSVKRPRTAAAGQLHPSPPDRLRLGLHLAGRLVTVASELLLLSLLMQLRHVVSQALDLRF